MRQVIVVWFLLLGIGLPFTAGAQSVDSDSLKSFSHLRVSSGGVATVYAVNLRGWDAKPGVGITIHTPFNIGIGSTLSDVGLGVSVNQWDSTRESLPNFRSVHMFIEWILTSAPTNPVNITGGVRAGNYFMAFDSNQISGERNESELAVSAVVGLRRTLFNRFDVFIESTASRVFTQPNLGLIEVRVGLSLTLNAPDWVRTVLE